VVVDAGSVRKDHLGLSDWYVQRSPAELFPVVDRRGSSDRQTWVAQWRACDRAARRGLDEGLAIQGNEAALVAAAVRAAPSGATVFVSNSMPVRDLDWVGDPAWGVRRVLGNRGASGIDGIVSTALGVAAAAVEPVVAILGDLAFLHDTNGLLQARSQDLDAVLVVIDNDGGGIFHMLPIESFEPAFTPYFATPHGLDLEKAARLYDVPFSEADSPQDLAVQVRRAVAAGGVRIIRTRTDRKRNKEAHALARELVAARLDSLAAKPGGTDRP
jgi:2-succinyl-5-enolpyruvyl-6-hydroxy-3-cyclohexene-1-carboxylate synthase